jgi:hypothetical protein
MPDLGDSPFLEKITKSKGTVDKAYKAASQNNNTTTYVALTSFSLTVPAGNYYQAYYDMIVAGTALGKARILADGVEIELMSFNEAATTQTFGGIYKNTTAGNQIITMEIKINISGGANAITANIGTQMGTGPFVSDYKANVQVTELDIVTLKDTIFALGNPVKSLETAKLTISTSEDVYTDLGLVFTNGVFFDWSGYTFRATN